jgi:ABC-type transport system substrate-binding protein
LKRPALLLALALSLALGAGAADAPRPKTLRIAFDAAETGFDPVQSGDRYSIPVALHTSERNYAWDPRARPAALRPVLAAALPESSSDFRTWTIRIRPGIRFADDPAFEGRPRELVAQDFVYSIERFADPASKSPLWTVAEQAGFSGLAQARQRALDTKRAFDYDRPVAGLVALDRYTLRLQVDAPRPRLAQTLTVLSMAVAREVVEAYGERIAEHPVGTGPFRLAQWRRSSLIVLERNPQYREVFYDARPAADDAEGQALLARFKGRRLPLVDRVEIAIVDENQPRWLAFLQDRLDVVTVPADYIALALPNGRLAPFLERRGVRSEVVALPGISYLYFNMEDPVVGGYDASKAALRRAVSLAIDIPREIELLRGGQALPAQSPIGAHMSGYDPRFRSEMGEYDPAKAKALLDLYGYVDRDGDGWRERPDGSPLVLELATESDTVSRLWDAKMKRDMDAIGVRIRFNLAQWPENLKAAQAGKLMMWISGWFPNTPDGQAMLLRLYGPAAGGFNTARFRLRAFDALYDRLSGLPDGPEREAVFDQAKRLAIAWMPEKTTVHRMQTHLVQPWLVGYRTPLFAPEWLQMVDIDEDRRAGH